MRSRTHHTSCNFGLVGTEGALPCTCGVSPAHLTADQMIRLAALSAAVHLWGQLAIASRNSRLGGDDVTDAARHFETYIRGGT